MPKNKIPKERLKSILKSIHQEKDNNKLIQRRQAWQTLAIKTPQDRHIIMMLDRELKRRGLVPPILSNVIPGRNKPRGREVS